MTRPLILAIDQGTTATTALLTTPQGDVVARGSVEFEQHYPEDGWVEHDPESLWQSVMEAVDQACQGAPGCRDTVAAIGLTNQRETTLLWERATDAPVHPAIVWQDRRTAERCRELEDDGRGPAIREQTGLLIDPYFSCTKLEWLLRRYPETSSETTSSGFAFGTVDSFLIWRLAGGGRARAPHVTDISNASRTSLMDLARGQWNPDMLALFGVPAAILPTIVPCSGVVAHTHGLPVLPDGIPIAGTAGDQQAALFGQGCLTAGDTKCTYGTGAFVLANTGEQIVRSESGLLSTVAWQIGARTTYALEGSAFVAGAAVQWLRDGLGLIETASQVEDLARQVDSSEGVVFVPALTGLGAPHWVPTARGMLCGITRATGRAHIARATLEGIACQVEDLLQAMREALGTGLGQLRVDGGAAANNLLMQIQSDVSCVSLDRPAMVESTARGAAMLAGLGVGLFESPAQTARLLRVQRSFEPRLSEEGGRALTRRWRAAVAMARGLATPR